MHVPERAHTHAHTYRPYSRSCVPPPPPRVPSAECRDHEHLSPSHRTAVCVCVCVSDLVNCDLDWCCGSVLSRTVHVDEKKKNKKQNRRTKKRETIGDFNSGSNPANPREPPLQTALYDLVKDVSVFLKTTGSASKLVRMRLRVGPAKATN